MTSCAGAESFASMMLLGMRFDAQSSTCAPLMYNWECGIDLSGAPLPSPSKSAKSIDIGHQRTLIARVAVSRVTASSLAAIAIPKPPSERASRPYPELPGRPPNFVGRKPAYQCAVFRVAAEFASTFRRVIRRLGVLSCPISCALMRRFNPVPVRRMRFSRRTNYVRFNHALQSENIG